ncbi:MAG: acetyl-CoA carboxylase carboxyl transferase subunit alpha/beta, partial [Deltaproteobacteria bacterium]|nr:acetyl-CoA carboxylase carboxyl transferase subunit alpha/beta [Deltaproteobacteria bacterium]
MDRSTEKRLYALTERLQYMRDIFGGIANENMELLKTKLDEYRERQTWDNQLDPFANVSHLEELFAYVERKLESDLSPMNRVHIVRHPQRVCLRDILENVYDNVTEIGGQDEHSIDPGMLIARAYITRRRRKKVFHQFVM